MDYVLTALTGGDKFSKPDRRTKCGMFSLVDATRNVNTNLKSNRKGGNRIWQ